jgi:putative ABC transport system permease protein
MVSALDKKALRDLWRLKGQATAIVLLVASAVTVFVGSTNMRRALDSAQRSFYAQYLFADLFTSARRIPSPVVARLSFVEGVAAVDARVVAEVTMELPGLDDVASARLVSVPSGSQPALNRLFLRSGRMPVAGPRHEALVSEGFAVAQSISADSTLVVIINGRRHTLTVTGVATSPEHLYAIRPGDLMPDDKRFAVIWLPHEDLAPALGMRGAFNDVTIRLGPGGSSRDVAWNVERVLAPYGGTGVVDRERQVSHRFLSDELGQLTAMAIAVPLIFLGVAAFLLAVVLSRLVSTQRQQVGALKALGYSSRAIGLHYAKMVLVIVLAGVGLGSLGGNWMGEEMARMYGEFYRFPVLVFSQQADVVAQALVLAWVAALAGVTRAVLHAVRIPPAEAMRPEPPATYHRTLLERLGLARFMGQPGRMVLRNLGRRPTRALMSAVGLAASVAILVVGLFFQDALGFIVDNQFYQATRENVTVAFTTPRPSSARAELESLPGVRGVELFRSVPVILRSGHVSYRTAITGLQEESASPRLHRVVDGKGRPISIPPDGMLLTRRLAGLLGLQVGDDVLVEVQEGQRQRRTVAVAALSDELIGVSATMELAYLNRLVGEGHAVSGAFMAVDSALQADVTRRLRKMPLVGSVALRSAAVASFRDTSEKYLLFFSAILVLFACLIAGGVAYNGARVSMQERERELATLRVVGFTRNETWSVLLGEMVAHVALAVPMGWAMGWGLARMTAAGMDSELFRVPVVILPRTYVLSAAVVVAAVLIVAMAVRNGVVRLDLVSVLKTRE